MEREDRITVTMFSDGTVDVAFQATGIENCDITMLPNSVDELNAFVEKSREAIKAMFVESGTARYISVTVGM